MQGKKTTKTEKKRPREKNAVCVAQLAGEPRWGVPSYSEVSPIFDRGSTPSMGGKPSFLRVTLGWVGVSSLGK